MNYMINEFCCELVFNFSVGFKCNQCVNTGSANSSFDLCFSGATLHKYIISGSILDKYFFNMKKIY